MTYYIYQGTCTLETTSDQLVKYIDKQTKKLRKEDAERIEELSIGKPLKIVAKTLAKAPLKMIAKAAESNKETPEEEQVNEKLTSDIQPKIVERRAGDPDFLVARVELAERELGFKAERTLADMVESSIGV